MPLASRRSRRTAGRRLTVFIPAAGAGTRLRPLTDDLPKALVAVRRKPALSHVLAVYPRDSRFVVAVGHKARLVHEYVRIAHADLDVTLVDIANFEGPGSGLGHTIACSLPWLEPPLAFHAVDSLVVAPWWPDVVAEGGDVVLAAGRAPASVAYRRIRADRDRRCAALSEPVRDPPPGWLTYVGVCAIADVERLGVFVRAAPGDVGEAEYLRGSISAGLKVRVVDGWHDVGTLETLAAARRALESASSRTSEKLSQATYVLNDLIVKVHAEQGPAKLKERRARAIARVVPPDVRASGHCLAYRKLAGTPLSALRDRAARFPGLLEWLEGLLWTEGPAPPEPAAFRRACRTFYRDETLARVEGSRLARLLRRPIGAVDGVQVEASMSELFDSLPWASIANGRPVRFHGDLHFDNVLVTDEGGFVLIDWRERFGPVTTYGDLYYELAKLRHALVLPNAVIDEPRFTVRSSRDADGRRTFVTEYARLDEDERSLAVLDAYVRDRRLDATKVGLVAGIVFLRMAPLYRQPAVAELLWLLAAREFATFGRLATRAPPASPTVAGRHRT